MRIKSIGSIVVLLLIVMLVLASCGGNAESGAGAGEESGTEQGAAEEQTGEQDLEEAKEPTEAKDSEDKAQDSKDEEGVKEMSTEINLDNITINTQSSIRIEGSKTIYIDPYKRTKAAHDADLILITHAHYDHFDAPSLNNVAKEDTVVICPFSMDSDVKRLGIGESQQAFEEGVVSDLKGGLAGITVEAVPAYNLNKNFHPKSNGWLGYIITMDGVRYYAAGDTDALPELEDVECDVAFVPVGGTYTMTAPEAAGLVNSIAPKYAVPIHYGTIVGRAADADTFGAALDDGIEMVKKVEDAK